MIFRLILVDLKISGLNLWKMKGKKLGSGFSLKKTRETEHFLGPNNKNKP